MTGPRATSTRPRLQRAALITFAAGWVAVGPMFLLYLYTMERFRAYDMVPIVLGPLLVKPSDWLLVGFLLALACFIAAMVLKARGTDRTHKGQRRSGPLTLGRILLVTVTSAMMVHALYHLAVAFTFPKGYERLDPKSEDGCTVVVETRTGMASQSGHLFLIPAGSSQLVDTGIRWSYDALLIDPEWSVTWNGEEATVRGPDEELAVRAPGDSVVFNGTGSSVTTFACE